MLPIIIGRLFDPMVLVIALIGGRLSPAWSWVAASTLITGLICAAVAALSEYRFEPGVLISSTLVAIPWAIFGFFLRKPTSKPERS